MVRPHRTPGMPRGRRWSVLPRLGGRSSVACPSSTARHALAAGGAAFRGLGESGRWGVLAGAAGKRSARTDGSSLGPTHRDEAGCWELGASPLGMRPVVRGWASPLRWARCRVGALLSRAGEFSGLGPHLSGMGCFQRGWASPFRDGLVNGVGARLSGRAAFTGLGLTFRGGLLSRGWASPFGAGCFQRGWASALRGGCVGLRGQVLLLARVGGLFGVASAPLRGSPRRTPWRYVQAQALHPKGEP